MRATDSEKEPMSIRIGISSGEADAADGDYFGVSVVEAARLCASADGDQILTSEITRLLASSRGGFELRSVGPRELRGLDAPVEAYEVRWTPKPPSDVAVPLPPRLQRAEGAVFVGRDAHCSLLDDALKHADVTAEQRVVLLSGEPGIGKTALVSRFAVEAHACGAAVLYGRCDEDLLVPYQPWVEALTHLVDNTPEHVLAEHVGERGADLVALVPALAARISDLPASRGTDTDTERHLLFGAVIDLLARSSTERAVALLLDDLQWADRATLQLLRNVASAAVPCRLVVVGTFRDANLGAHHPLTELLAALHRESGVERMVLGGLDDVELQALMEAAAGHALAQDGIMLRDALLAETDGNPFFVVEILRHLAETGAIEQGASGRWVTSEDLHTTSLPVSVREVVGHRVERLGADATRVLSAAAVIGCDFDLALLLRIVDLDEDHLLDVLDEALRVSLVREEPGSPERYSFVHALIQRTIYDELAGARRRRLHGRIASALEELPGARIERIAELAHHWLATSLPENALRAYECAMAAGEGAMLRLAPDEAVRWFSRALELVAQLDDPTTARCGTLIKLGLAQRLAGVPEFREILIEAGWLAQSSGDADRLVAAALANSRGFQSNSGRTDDEHVAMLRAALDAIGDSSPVQRARLLALLGTESSYAPDVDVDALFDEALALTFGIDDAAARLQVMNAVQLSYMTPHNLERRRALLAEQAALIVRADPAQRALVRVRT